MKNLRTEEEIVSNWKGDIDKPVVSICCITFNHELYIEDALEGFLIQETDFAFEILIHDDASTDRTAEIIRKYEAQFPNIIKPIYQVENQYSKQVSVSFVFNVTRAKGEFIAFCEGDDYWKSATHLNDGCHVLKSNNNISIYGSACVMERNNLFIAHKAKRNRYDLKNYILEQPFIVTCSLIVKSSICKAIAEIPVMGGRYFAGDSRIKLISLTKGDMFVGNNMSVVYRKGTIGSWSNRVIDREVIMRELLDNISITREVALFNEFSSIDALYRRVEDELIGKGCQLAALKGIHYWLLFVLLQPKALSRRHIKLSLAVSPLGPFLKNIKYIILKK